MSSTEQITTGIAGLDRLLRGGLRRGGLHLIVGEPGVGKTVLAHQIGAFHARAGRQVLYLTAVVETHQTLLSQFRTFSFFDPSIVSHTFYYASLTAALQTEGLPGVHREIARLVPERAPALLMLDGLQGIREIAEKPAEYHRFLTFLQAQCSSTGATGLLIANREGVDTADPMYTVSDAILALDTLQSVRRRIRTIEVRKLRGVHHLTGVHLLRITGSGVEVFPRLEALVADQPPEETPVYGRVRFGIDGLDAMVGGGLGSGAVTLVTGTPGAGKTSIGLSFLAAGIEAGEGGLFVGFHETPDRLLTKADALGLPLRAGVQSGGVRFQWWPSADLLVDCVAQRVLETVERHGIRRVIIDGANDLVRGLAEPARAVPFLNAFMDLLRARGVAVLLTQELSQIFSLDFVMPLPDVSAAVDNIVLLRYVELDGRLRRLLSILKVRDQEYDSSVREFSLSGQGIRIGDTFDRAGRAAGGSSRPRAGEGTDA
ncbi:MAG TPA: ATPase domain-containing protein [Longimicrobiales bacterium]|nr:ATPase domain-containing protein [Longimicrobiales bacterium]